MGYIGTGLALCIASQCTNHTGLALCIDTSILLLHFDCYSLLRYCWLSSFVRDLCIVTEEQILLAAEWHQGAYVVGCHGACVF